MSKIIVLDTPADGKNESLIFLPMINNDVIHTTGLGGIGGHFVKC